MTGSKRGARGMMDRVTERLRALPKGLRIAAGILLVLLGCAGFLPVVGFWMIPAGLIVLAIDVPWLRPPLARGEAFARRAARWVQGRVEWKVLRRTVDRWSADRAGSMAAAIGFYTVFSLAPTLLLVSWLAGAVFTHASASEALTQELAGLIGPGGARMLEQVLTAAVPPSSLSTAALIGLGALAFGATTVFVEINAALNIIWRSDDGMGDGLIGLVRSRLLAVSVIFAFGFLLMVSLAVSAGVTAASDYVSGSWAALAWAVEAVNFALSLAMTFLLFSMIYKILPSVHVPWRRVWLAGLTAALLFNLGKSLIGTYIGSSDVTTTYGAASALIVVLLWVYYSVMIFLFGAELSAAHAYVMGQRPKARGKAKARAKS